MMTMLISRTANKLGTDSMQVRGKCKPVNHEILGRQRQRKKNTVAFGSGPDI